MAQNGISSHGKVVHGVSEQPTDYFSVYKPRKFGVSLISDFDQDLPVLNVYFPVFGHNRGSEKRAWPITRKRKVGGLLNLDPYPII